MQPTTSPRLPGQAVQPWYKHRWPWLLMIGPAIVVVAGFYTGWLAYTQQDALVVDDYYTQGKAINMDLRRDQVAADMGLTLGLAYDPAKDILSGALTSHGNPYAGNLKLQLIHSTQPNKDITLNLDTRSDGTFQMALPFLEISRWKVLVENSEKNWRLTGEWPWPAEPKIVIKP